MMTYRQILGDSHYIYISNISGAEIICFAKSEHSTSNNAYLISTISINQQKKQITSAYNFNTKKIEHSVNSLAGDNE